MDWTRLICVVCICVAILDTTYSSPAAKLTPTTGTKTCSNLTPPANGGLKYLNSSSSLAVYYKCRNGFWLIGGFRRICQASGKWSGKDPKCRARPSRIIKTCKRPKKPRHGSYSKSYKTKFKVGEAVFYYCYRGYRLKGKMLIRCTRSGAWSDVTPKCRNINKARCKDPGTPANGTRSGRLFQIGTAVRFFCKSGFELVGKKRIHCQRNRKWSNKIPTCQVPDPLRNLKKVANNLRRHFVDKLELITSDSRARSGLSSGASGLDLVFVFDSSASVGQNNFRKGIAFAKTIIDEFGISASPMGTRIAVITFDTTARLVFNLVSNRIVDKDAAIQQLENLQFQGGGTATKLALTMVLRDVIPEIRNNSKKALFLITDGQSNTGGNPTDEARFLRDRYNFEMFAIGVSNNVNQKELKSIASQPFRTHVFLLKDFESLVKLKELITAKGTDYSECGVAGDTQLRSSRAHRIVGGVMAKQGAWPWLAAIFLRGFFRCGGALIDREWVLTAAHCFQYDGKFNVSDIQVTLGEHNRNLQEGTEQNVIASKVVVHHKSVSGKLDYDIALVKLQTPVKLTPYVRTICLPLNQDKLLVRPHLYGLIAGWGHIKHVKPGQVPGAASIILNQAEIPFTSRQICGPASSFPVTERMLCAGDGAGHKAACKGDSGSPLVVKRPDDHWTIVGISSWGEGCATPGKYGVYTNVFSNKYSKWIRRKSGIVGRKF